jgi:hypothetical protein
MKHGFRKTSMHAICCEIYQNAEAQRQLYALHHTHMHQDSHEQFLQAEECELLANSALIAVPLSHFDQVFCAVTRMGQS